MLLTDVVDMNFITTTAHSKVVSRDLDMTTSIPGCDLIVIWGLSQGRSVGSLGF